MFRKIFLAMLCISSALHASPKDDSEKKLEIALNLDSIKTPAVAMHKNLDSVFDQKLAKSRLKRASPELISQFRNDYERAVDKHMSIESLTYTFAFHLSSKLTLEQLNNNLKFYQTEIGQKVKKNIRSGLLANNGFTRSENEELLSLYKKYEVFDLLKIMPEVMNLWKLSLNKKVHKLRLEYNTLEAEYLIKQSDGN